MAQKGDTPDQSVQPPELNIPLRVCRVCGLEAHTEEDLALFTKHKSCLHGRDAFCKRCCNASKSKTAEFVEIFRARPTGMNCHFCGETVTTLEGRESQSLVIYSLDGNHENWDYPNKVPAHRGCHMTGERHHNWKGDEATDQSKYLREWRKRRRNR